MRQDFFNSKTYKKLIERLKTMMPAADESSYHEDRLKSYWEMGKMIYENKEKLEHKQKSQYISKVAKDLEKQKSHLYDLQQFYQRFPKGAPQVIEQGNIKWSHVKHILPIEQTQQSLFYLEQAAEDDLSAPELRKAIKGDLFTLIQNKEDMESILKRPTSPLFLFQARLLSNYDGDTPTVMIDQGFDTWRKITVRLRGINTPELHGPHHNEALASKQFLEATLSPLHRFLLKTYKTDSFGRFIGDIIYHPVWTDLEKIFYKGIFLNVQMIQMGLAKPMLY